MFDPLEDLKIQVAYNEMTPAAAPMGIVVDQQLAPQGQIGSVAGGVLGGLLPFEAGPQAYPGTYWLPQTAYMPQTAAPAASKYFVLLQIHGA